MNWPKRKLFSYAGVCVALVLICACGVKGDPLPPEKPVELGRGRPTYKRATEGLKIEKNKTVPVKPVEKKEDDEKEDDDGQK